jgi:hypothetical protein
LILTFGILGSYTKNYQFATLNIGKEISKTDLQTGLQDAITPPIQNMRNIISLLLLIFIFVLSTYIYTWYWALCITILTFFIVPHIFDFFIPKYDHPYYLKSIIHNMEKRIIKYKINEDSIREFAATRVLDKLIEYKEKIKS